MLPMEKMMNLGWHCQEFLCCVIVLSSKETKKMYLSLKGISIKTLIIFFPRKK